MQPWQHQLKKIDTCGYSSDNSIDFISNFIEYFLLDVYLKW